MIELSVKVVLSYLLGSVIGSLLVGRLSGGVDIRTMGSGNAGATNALRARGKGFAFTVLLIDIAKGWVATRVIARLAMPGIPPAAPALEAWLASGCAIAVMVGHVYPLWYGFRGGKGVATLLGVLIGLDPWLLVPVLITWIVAAMLFGYVGLASMIAAVALPVAAVAGAAEPNTPLFVFGLCAVLLIVFTHRTNIARMRMGKEPRARRLWLFGGKDA
jgi:acyl phosphate:glycerol-3-phosphate acyltransferase